ncbi:RHS repeat domain-containing protein [Chryseobacterium sp.]|uniref:RHS repeat domain-containing protein n=1 Tax=Chryseobacterium sp. TaxID=1871047 RepID=UPI002FC73E48
MSLNYNYKYNGKELQETGMYDYGWRNYMPDLGRWGAIDPKSELLESASLYVYALNSPILYIDKDGELPILINGRVFDSKSDRANASYWSQGIQKDYWNLSKKMQMNLRILVMLLILYLI